MRLRMAALLLTLLLLVGSADVSVQSLFVEYDLSDDGVATEVLTYTLTNIGGEQIPDVFARIPAKAFDVSVQGDGGGDVELTMNRTSDKVLVVSFSPALAPNATTSFSASFRVKGLIESYNTSSLFSGRLSLPRELDELNVRLRLPEGHFLLVRTDELDESGPVMVPQALVSTDGRRLILEWSRSNLIERSFDIFVKFQAPQRIETVVERPVPTVMVVERETPTLDMGQGIVFLAIGLVLGLLVAVVAWGWLPLMASERGGVTAYPKAELKWDEREVVDALLESDGELNQNVLVVKVSFSKAKLSKLLTHMEARGILTKACMGRVNRIKLLE